MKLSQLFMPTLRENPAEAEIASHIYLARGGYIRKLAAGIYSLLPLGLRVVRKVEQIVREEMNAAGAQEVLLPSLIPAELWQESGRWDLYGRELLRVRDRHDREFCYGPTHEEVITDLVRGEVRSYRQLPLTLYQIQTKFRDEIRPRFGLMRAREFMMKDAYSFHSSNEELDSTYKRMYEAYCRIFERCGLDYKVVEADTGLIGGKESHEFMVTAETGENEILYCDTCSYASNVEVAKAYNPPVSAPVPAESKMRKVMTPNVRTAEELRFFFMVNIDQIIKSIIYVADSTPVLVMVRGDHEVNEIKLMRILGCSELALADEDTVERITGAAVGFAGPVGLKEKIKIIADEAVMSMGKGIIGANENDVHYRGACIGIDIVPDMVGDIRIAQEGDVCAKCHDGKYLKTRGIEVGHIFKLGTKYSEAMQATFHDSDGKEKPFIMGCYGIGIGRTVAAAIEQNQDSTGIKWPVPLAPFTVNIIIVNIHDQLQAHTAEELYVALNQQGIPSLLDDRDERVGVKFKDAELIGAPVNLVIGKSLAAEGTVEVQFRKENKKEHIIASQVVKIITESLQQS